MVVPEPLDHLFASLDANIVMVLLDAVHSLLIGRLLIPLYETAADDEDVAGPWLQIFFFDDFFDLRKLDLVTSPGVILDALAFCMCDIVDKDTTGYDTTTLSPVCLDVSNVFGTKILSLGRRQAHHLR